MKDRSIGIFDSGYGGLTVLRELLKIAPKGHYIYFGDNKRVPYGDKSKEKIVELSKKAVSFLEGLDTKAIVIACNTVSTRALEELREVSVLPIIGIGESGAKGAIEKTENKKVLVLATKSTVEGKLYEHRIGDIDPSVEVRGVACPKLVPIIESDLKPEEKNVLILEALREYRSKAIGFDYDTIILGCTHYPYILDEIREVFGKDKEIVNPSYEQAKKVLESFPEELDRKEGSLEIYTSGNRGDFEKFAKDYLSLNVLRVHNFNF
ncbi:glutamate racemase [Lagierella sp.]|uniref:glutamate racemase n=1 Tax=Lagierella sp. TaxID=2849657 RepID=UPI002611F91A|nr:glutamate racemase [Lagierella sp.]